MPFFVYICVLATASGSPDVQSLVQKSLRPALNASALTAVNASTAVLGLTSSANLTLTKSAWLTSSVNFTLTESARGELSQHYNNTTASAEASNFARTLAWWHSFATKHDIPYSIAYGSLLGYVRHPELCFIPYDHDMDVVIDKKGIAVLRTLAGIANSGVLFANSSIEKTEGTVVVHPFYDEFLGLPGSNRNRRYNCYGEEVFSDDQRRGDLRCMFNGPIARYLVPGSNVFLDMFVYYAEDNNTFSQQLQLHGGNFANVVHDMGCAPMGNRMQCHYPPAALVSTLPATSKVSCGGVDTYAFTEPLAHEFLSAWYTENFMLPLQS